jgi:hypothetical protein
VTGGFEYQDRAYIEAAKVLRAKRALWFAIVGRTPWDPDAVEKARQDYAQALYAVRLEEDRIVGETRRAA